MSRFFDRESHLEHVCEYSADKEYICEDKTKASVFQSNKVMSLLKNNLRHLNSIIDEFPGESSDGKVNKSHTCKICKRSYVHASGLARHLKSHGSNLERLAKTRPITKRIQDVQVSCQCALCGRIFSSVSRGLRHYEKDHALKCDPDEDHNEENQPMEDKDDEDKDTVSIFRAHSRSLCWFSFKYTVH